LNQNLTLDQARQVHFMQKHAPDVDACRAFTSVTAFLYSCQSSSKVQTTLCKHFLEVLEDHIFILVFKTEIKNQILLINKCL